MPGVESLLLLFMLSIPSSQAWSIDYPSPIANLPSLWTNNNATTPYNATYNDGSTIRAILVRQNPAWFGPSFACGFICTAPCNVFLFAVFFISIGDPNNPAFNATARPRVVWTANRYHPVKENASVQLTKDGNLILRDFDGSLVWSTNTSGSPVVGMNLAETGNLILFNVMGKTVWESFEHPTDTLLIGQSLWQGKRLTSTSLVTNRTQGQFYLTMLDNGLYAFIDADPPQLYYQKMFNISDAIVRSKMNISSGEAKNCTTYISFLQGSLSAFASFNSTNIKLFDISLPLPSSAQFISLDDDGHLRVYRWDGILWKSLADVLHVYPDECAYPTVCGQYGICSQGQCSCPSGNSDDDLFHQLDDRQPNLGCSLATPLSCDLIQYHQLLPLPNVTYFNFAYNLTTDEESCKEACLQACSCKAVFFRHQNVSNGSCYLTPKIFSLMNYQPEVVGYKLSAYVKVQMLPLPSSKKIDTTAYHVGVPVLVAVICLLILIIRRTISRRMEEDDPFKGVAGIPTRFSYKQLREATNNFSKKLGQGGFGPVYEGKLGNVKIAVKCLRDIGHGKEEFMAEVITIGSIHHINLVRLIGYCSDKFHRLLVYEHISNGSLDKWIFSKNQSGSLSWVTRYKIILDIAKGLAYLHEECRQKIAHLDIKPGNILLDDKFNAKISDFGLAKLIDRDQSHVMTKIRGTRGYLAPEWLTSTITEKADIYSFGVVVLEIVSRRKNLDNNQPEGSNNLINILQEKIKVGQVLDIVGNQDEDIHLHGSEMTEVIKLAVWCLQRDCSKRPAMSQVVKVLEGAMYTETTSRYDATSREDIFDASSPVSPVPVSAR
ncbi:G-type lectin S-receptor-like serine/threonine-protein kinase SD2-5 [Phragmites australis]|uniref:G-type lectin S-receptor-like serine/threonine-protein kinase SD2-5 n=1 Tax=Phragmites australis TaxID=29695 RepID=UPI002D7821F3|nr:G-type lectin S-receptor-like serine/threonine-protein kinase SD2-5 [Phragmites australis]